MSGAAWAGEAPNPGGGADGGDEHGVGHAGGEADEGGDMDADDEDDDEYDTGMANEYAAGQGGAEPSPAVGALHPGDGGDGGEAPEPAVCETCDESARTAEAAAAAFNVDEVAKAGPQRSKRKRVRSSSGRSHHQRGDDD